MTEERYLRVPYHFLGAAVVWAVGVLLMIVSTVNDVDDLARWALVVIAAASVWWCHAALARSRIRLMQALELQLQMHEQAGLLNGVPRIPSGR